MQNDDNKQLHRRFHKKQSFYKDMEKVSRKYLEFQQQVYYLPLKDINPQMIVKLQQEGELSKRQDLYIINGQYQPTGPKGFEKLILQLVQTIPRPKKSFGLIYINTLAENDEYNDFKKVLELLPIEYLFNLTKIYVLQASFFSKAFSWLSFGIATNYIKNKMINVDNIRELSHQTNIDYGLLKNKLPKNVVNVLRKQHEHEHKAEEHRPRGIYVQDGQKIDRHKKNPQINIESHFKMPNPSKPNQQSFEQSKGPIPYVSTHLKSPFQTKVLKEMSQYEIGPTGAPIILQMLLYFFNNKKQSLKQEGLFRKSVSIDEQTEILLQLNNKNYNYLQKVTDPHVIANAIKRFLSNFKVPVIPYDIFELFMSKAEAPQLPSIVVESIKSLPKINRMVIFLLFDFLKNSVVPNANLNKMGVNNLCIVFGPCLMKAEVASMKDLVYAAKTIAVTNIIYSKFEDIFGDKNAQMKLKRSSYKDYRISQNKLRQSKSSNSKESFEERNKSAEKEELVLPFLHDIQEISLLHKTSAYIKEALEENQSDDEPADQIAEAKQAAKEEQAKKDVPEPEKATQDKEITVNIFVSPSIEVNLPTMEQSLHNSIQTSNKYLKPSEKEQ